MSDNPPPLALAIDAQKATAGAAQFKGAADSVIDASKGIEAQTVKLVESQGRQQRAVDSLSRRLDPLGQAVRDATRDMERLTRISQGSGEAAARAGTLLAAAQARVTAAQQAASASTRTADVASRSFAAQTTETTGALRQMLAQQSGLVGTFATGGAFAVGMLAAAKAVEALGTALKAIPLAGDAANASIARIAATVGDTERAGEIFQKLQESSRQTGISVTDSAGAFQRFSIAAKDIGATNDQVLSLVAGLQKFALVSGASTQETAAATQQLAQALASGVLQGDELRSILENMPLFAQALAKEMGTSIGALRSLGAEGKLTSDVVFPAMMRAAQGVDDVFAGMPTTMARAQQQFDVAAQSFLTHIDKALGLSQKLVTVLQAAAGLVDKMRGLSGGITDAERQAELIVGVEKQRELIAGLDAAIQDAQALGGKVDPAGLATWERQRDAAKAELQKFRDELLQINNRAVLRDEAERAAAEAARLAAESEGNKKSTEELRKKVDKDYAINKEYSDNLEKLNKARNAGDVSEADYLKLSTALLKERDEALAKLTKSEGGHKTAVERTGRAIAAKTEKVVDAAGAMEKEIASVDEATQSQLRITAAYDGTQASLDKVQAQEKAHAAALKAGLLPSMENYEATVSRLSDSYLASTSAAREFQQVQSSVNAIFDALSTAADRLGQGLVDAFLSGKGAAVNFGNIARSVLASLGAELVKLAVINPLINSVGGGTRDTLSAGLRGLGGGAGGGNSILGGLSNASTFGGITDALGITDFAGQLSGFGEYLGLTGSNGLLGGIGNSITSLLGTGINGAGLSSATNAALAGMGGSFGPAAPSSVLAAQGGATFGQLLSGVGLGFGAGSLAGGLVQSSLGKVGPGPSIGAGGGALAGAALGTLAFPGLGTVLGLLGGVLGGAGGGLIGPKAATPFSATGLNNNNGQLGVGQTFSQIVDVSQEVATLQQQVNQINAILSATGTRIANNFSSDQYNQNRIIGGNSGQWLNFGQGDGRPGDIAAAFGELRFGSDNQYIDRAVSGKSFANVEALQAATAGILDFVNTTAPALKALADATPSFGAGTLTTTIDQLSRQFDDAIATAQRLGYAEYDLTEARTKAMQIANDNAAKQLNEINQSFLVRTTAARGIVSGSTQMQLDAALLNFDIAAEKQRETFRTTLLSTFGDAFKGTQAFADQMAAQEAALGAERLVTAKSYLDQIASVEAERVRAAKQATEQAAGNAAGVVQSITAYLRDISGGAESVLSPSQKYNAARSDFETTLSSARGGDASALSGLTSVAETFRAASRAMFGSGTDYVRNFERITEGLRSVSEMSVESLTSAVFTAETRTQTQVLTNALADLRVESARQTAIMQGMRDDQRRASSGPPASRAA